MARRPFAGTGAEWVFDDTTGRPLPGRDEQGVVITEGTAWTAESGGVPVTDLQTSGGAPIAGGIIVPDQDGRVPRFLGPDDGTAALWLDFGQGRFLVLATDIPDRLDALETAPGGGGGGTANQPPATAVVYASTFRSVAPATDVGVFQWQADGTSDQTEINAAITAVANEGGGKVLLMGSIFTISAPIYLKTGVWLCGEGLGTEIRTSADFQQGMVMLYEERTGTGGVDVYGAHATKLSDLSLNAQGREVHGVHYIGNSGQIFTAKPAVNPDPSHVIENLFILNCGSATFAGHGMRFTGSNLRAMKTSKVRILAVRGCGVWVEDGCADSHWTDIEVGSSGSGGPAPSASSTAPVGHGFYISGANHMIQGCKGWYSRFAGFTNRGTRNTYTGCHAQDNHGDGFRVLHGKSSFSACLADSNGSQGDATTRGTAGFHITTDFVSMSACQSFDRGGQAWVQAYGFKVTSGMLYSRVTGCITYANALGSVTGTPGTGVVLDIQGDANGR